MMIAVVVVLGFKHEIRNKVMGFDSQIRILPTNTHNYGIDNTFITLSDTLDNIIKSSLPQNANISLTIKQPCILKTDDNFMGVVFKGMDNNYDWKFVNDNLVNGSIPDYRDYENNQNRIVISRIMANAMQLDIGDKIYAYFFNDNNIRTRRFEIAAIYESHFGEYDKLIAFAPIATMQKINRVSSASGNEIEIRGIDINDISDISYSLHENLAIASYTKNLQQPYYVDNVFHTGAVYFNWLDLLDTNVVVILILMALVSGFTLVSCLFMIILERISMIGIMKSLGATNAQIRRIFIYLTEKLVLKGILIGNIIALSIIMLQNKYHIIPLDPEAYYLSYVPVEINWWHIVALNIGTISVSILMLVLPSHLISTISPSKTIKFE